jgi:hypothetical protein
MAPRFKANNPGNQFSASINGMSKPIARAAKIAMTDAGKQAQTDGRKSMAGAGFTSRWQKSLALKVYPLNRDAISPAALIYSRIGYSGIFEKGGVISGKPLLWLPLKSVPRPGGNSIPVGKYEKVTGNKLFSIRTSGKLPLLGARIVDRVVGQKQIKKTVPLYFGQPKTNIPRKFRIREAAERAADRLGEFYFAAFRDE